MNRWPKILIAAAATISLCQNLRADVKLAGIFGDHMVLQQGATLPIWGTGDAGEAVTVEAGGKSAKTTVGADGKWRANLAPLSVSDKPIELTVTGKNTLKIEDVLVGEVWLGSGQSNMQLSLKGVAHSAEALKDADQPMIRLCSVGNRALAAPLADRELHWVLCTPETAKGFSAVTYSFGHDLHENLKVPVGLIGSYVAGTPAQSWTNLAALQAHPELTHYADELGDVMNGAATRPDSFNAGAPTSLYNGMIAPLIPYAIKGVVWYQGESNADRYEEYRTLFPALIEGWRKQWGEGDFPFLFVQLPGFGRRSATIEHSDWAFQREAQASALKLPNTGMAVILELVPPRAILHPKNKLDVGHRLSLVARHVVYGQDVESSGPIFKSMTIADGGATISFDHATGLKMAAPIGEGTGKPEAVTEVTGFTLAGEDHQFYPAKATIQGEQVNVTSDAVKTPVAVRYAWAQNPQVDLFNGSDLPAAPFRTDTWTEAATKPTSTQ